MLALLRKVPFLGYVIAGLVASLVFVYFQVRRLQEELALQKAAHEAELAAQDLARANAERDAAQADASAVAEHSRSVTAAEDRYHRAWSRTVDVRQRIAGLSGEALAEAVNGIFVKK